MGTKVTGHDPRLPIGTRKCQCGSCLRYFNSPAAFDAHRDNGECLTVRQMQKKGMATNAEGNWVTEGWKDDRLSE